MISFIYPKRYEVLIQRARLAHSLYALIFSRHNSSMNTPCICICVTLRRVHWHFFRVTHSFELQGPPISRTKSRKFPLVCTVSSKILNIEVVHQYETSIKLCHDFTYQKTRLLFVLTVMRTSYFTNRWDIARNTNIGRYRVQVLPPNCIILNLKCRQIIALVNGDTSR